jgi:hypothetical protein
MIRFEWFMEDDPQPYGSWCNGAAMLISPVGLLATSEDDVIGWADAATVNLCTRAAVKMAAITPQPAAVFLLKAQPSH